MDIKDLLIKDAMIMDLQATTKKAAIDEMVQKCMMLGEFLMLMSIKKVF